MAVGNCWRWMEEQGCFSRWSCGLASSGFVSMLPSLADGSLGFSRLACHLSYLLFVGSIFGREEQEVIRGMNAEIGKIQRGMIAEMGKLQEHLEREKGKRSELEERVAQLAGEVLALKASSRGGGHPAKRIRAHGYK